MAVANADQYVSVEFIVGNDRFKAELRRGQIVHEAFHAALPPELTVGKRLMFRTEKNEQVFADNFIGDIMDHLTTTTLVTEVEPIGASSGSWRNVGFDHLAITVADRSDARNFLRDVLQMEVVRDDAHLTVMTTGHTALFLFDAGQEAPLSPGTPSTWHHIGFVVNDLEAAYGHLQRHRDRLVSDFTMLERDERWSLYFFYKNGDVTFMFQFSEVKEAERGFSDPVRSQFASHLYDYARRPYGVTWELESTLSGNRERKEDHE
jgi:hypothetical protein